MKPLFKTKKRSALEAKYAAQKIAYAPIIFQTVRCMRELGILEQLDKAGRQGIDAQTIANHTGLSLYGVETLIESGLSCDVVEQNDNGLYLLSKTGWFLLNDEMTRINMDYNHYICYKGLYDLDKSIETEKPIGLKVFGEQWETLYQALPHLPSPIKESWYAFDHYYSDGTYPLVLPIILRDKPKTLMDMGANVGKFSILAAAYDARLQITMLDLPDQLENAIRNVQKAGFSERVKGMAVDLLNPQTKIPSGTDVFWLSQFLSCFSDKEIVRILQQITTAMEPKSTLYIMETCWDRQQHEAAAYSLINTSPYFTCIASGNSKMYSAEALLKYVDEAGLKVRKIHDSLGICHTLFECVIRG